MSMWFSKKQLTPKSENFTDWCSDSLQASFRKATSVVQFERAGVYNLCCCKTPRSSSGISKDYGTTHVQMESETDRNCALFV